MSARFALVTDTTSDLTRDLIAQHNIYMIPQIIVWGRESLREGIDIDAPTFYTRLAAASEMPTTSRPVPADTVALFERAVEETGADSVVVLAVSKDVSGTVSSVEQARKEVSFPVHLVDTRTISLALGMTTLRIAELRDTGASAEEAVAAATEIATNSRALFTPSTLEFLRRGGRIGNARHLLGTALSIKPILTLVDGKVEALESVRTRKRALGRMVELIGENIDPAKPLYLGACHANAPDELAMVVAELQQRYNPAQLYQSWIGASIGVHAGPGVFGLMAVQ
ncbi:MAG: DegV family protein [Anaerolineae bacterium]|nr:DegV family protein [Anaerolineae bacterium]